MKITVFIISIVLSFCAQFAFAQTNSGCSEGYTLSPDKKLCLPGPVNFKYVTTGLTLSGVLPGHKTQDITLLPTKFNEKSLLSSWEKKIKDGVVIYSKKDKEGNGTTVSSKVALNWTGTYEKNQFSTFVETIDKDDNVISRKLVSSDLTEFYRTCDENLQEQRAAKRVKQKVVSRYNCTAITTKLCYDLQNSLNRLTKDEYNKCSDVFHNLHKNKLDAQNYYDDMARAAAKNADGNPSAEQRYRDIIDIYDDIQACGEFANLRGKQAELVHSPISKDTPPELEMRGKLETQGGKRDPKSAK